MPAHHALVHARVRAWVWMVPAALAMAVLTGPIAAQTVYRCGPAGNTYSQQPCAEGRAVDVSDSRNADQVAQARADGREARRMADQMARERLAFDAAHPARAAAGIHSAPPPKVVSTAAGQASKPKGLKRASRKPTGWRPDEGEDFVAKAPAPAKKARKEP